VRSTIRVNLVIALGAMGVMGLLTLVGSWLARPVPLALGVVTHEGGTVLVVLNALRLLAFPGLVPTPGGPAINAHEQHDARGPREQAGTTPA
jgi:Cd2+/Zn2+-exporting ATPase